MKMPKFLQAPVFEDEYLTYQAFILHVSSLLLSIGACFLFIYSIIYPKTFPLYLYLALFLLSLQAILMYLNYKKKTRLGAWLYLIIGWVVLSFMVFREGGIRSPNFAFYFCYITIAGVLINWRAGIGYDYWIGHRGIEHQDVWIIRAQGLKAHGERRTILLSSVHDEIQRGIVLGRVCAVLCADGLRFQ